MLKRFFASLLLLIVLGTTAALVNAPLQHHYNSVKAYAILQDNDLKWSSVRGEIRNAAHQAGLNVVAGTSEGDGAFRERMDFFNNVIIGRFENDFVPLIYGGDFWQDLQSYGFVRKQMANCAVELVGDTGANLLASVRQWFSQNFGEREYELSENDVENCQAAEEKMAALFQERVLNDAQYEAYVQLSIDALQEAYLAAFQSELVSGGESLGLSRDDYLALLAAIPLTEATTFWEARRNGFATLKDFAASSTSKAGTAGGLGQYVLKKIAIELGWEAMKHSSVKVIQSFITERYSIRKPASSGRVKLAQAMSDDLGEAAEQRARANLAKAGTDLTKRAKKRVKGGWATLAIFVAETAVLDLVYFSAFENDKRSKAASETVGDFRAQLNDLRERIEQGILMAGPFNGLSDIELVAIDNDRQLTDPIYAYLARLI